MFGLATSNGMKLIIGLGNPGEEYQNTRHNIGFMAVDAIAKQSDANFSFEKKFNAEVAKGPFDTTQGKKPIILAKPHTFVNKSGEAVKKLKTFYKTKLEDIIIIRDDLDIEFGQAKLSFGKGSGGHRGIESILGVLKTEKFWQLKIGTANRSLAKARQQKNLKAKKEAVGNFVLSRFTPNEQTEIKRVLKNSLQKLENALN